MSVLKSLQDIPEIYDRCLIDLVTAEHLRREIVLLHGREGCALILAEQMSQAGAIALRDVRARAAQRGHVIAAEYRASSGLIPLIYQRRSAANATAGSASAVYTEAQKNFDNLVRSAGDLGASDIHMVLRPKNAEIQFRIHGELETVSHWTSRQAQEVCACAYTVLANNKDATWDPSRRQDANIARSIEGKLYRIRYAHHAIYPEGVHVVLRLLSTGRDFSFAPTLQHLGYADAQAAAIEAMVAEPSGVLIISGETGSGKSTTLANLMHILLKDSGGSLSLQTVEDPPEYEVPGIIQSPVAHSRDDQERGINPFAEAIRAAMRCDPDIIAVGEVRDLETARLAAAAAESGHPVLTTLHASRALNILSRLEGMGATMPNNPLDRAMLCAPQFIAGLIHQTLIPVLCPACSLPFERAVAEGRVDAGLEARARAVAGAKSGHLRMRGDGCPNCRKGVVGRTVCAEVVTPEPQLMHFLRERMDQEAFEHWLKSGGYSIRDHAIDKMCAGIVSPRDAEACLGRLRLESAASKRTRVTPLARDNNPK
jgi:type II secretory ATPase GspE/PulE/Tfp pilus assembly ATPase PilB-like protein